MNRLIAIAALCLVVGALIAGLIVVGSPNHARNTKHDERRLMDLGQIARSIDCKTPNRMPTELSEDELRAVCNQRISKGFLIDPETDEFYDFQIISDVEINICVTFYDVEELKKMRFYKRNSPKLKFDGNVGCYSQTFDELEPA